MIKRSDSFLWHLKKYPILWEKYTKIIEVSDNLLEVSANHNDIQTVDKCLMTNDKLTPDGYNRALIALSARGQCDKLYITVLQRSDLEIINTQSLLKGIARGGNVDMLRLILPFIFLKYTTIDNIDAKMLLNELKKNGYIWTYMASYLITKHSPSGDIWNAIARHCKCNYDLSTEMSKIVKADLNEKLVYSIFLNYDKLDFIDYELSLMKDAVFSDSESMMKVIWNKIPDDKKECCDVRCWIALRGHLEMLIYLDEFFNKVNEDVAVTAYVYKQAHILEYCLRTRRFNPLTLIEIMEDNHKLNDLILSVAYKNEDKEMLTYCLERGFFDNKLKQIMEPNNALNDICRRRLRTCSIM